MVCEGGTWGSIEREEGTVRDEGALVLYTEKQDFDNNSKFPIYLFVNDPACKPTINRYLK